MKKVFTLIFSVSLLSRLAVGQTVIYGPVTFGSSGVESLSPMTNASGTWFAYTPSPSSSTYSNPTASGNGAASIGDYYTTSDDDALVSSGFSTSSKTGITVRFSEWVDDASFPTSDIGLQYSLDGTTWTDIAFTSTATISSYSTLRTVSLPVGTENQSTLYVRFHFLNDGPSNGFSYFIDDFSVYGNASATNYYNKSTGVNLDVLTSWGLNPDGSGAAPSSFTTANQVFNVTNGTSLTTSSAAGNWTVSGSGSKIIVGNGSSAITLTALRNIFGTVDVTNNATIKINANTASPTTTFGTLSTGSTVEYGRAGDQTLRPATYHNLKLSGSGTKTISSAVTVNNTFDIGSLTAIAQNSTLTLLGTITGTTPFSSTTASIFNFNKTGGGSIGTLTFSASNSVNNISISSGSLTLGSGLTLSGTSPTITIASGATLDANMRIIAGTAATELIDVQGTITTSNLNGFSAGASTTFTSDINTPSLGSTSTVHYNASSGSQAITPFPQVNAYQNLTLSGAADKVFSGSNYYISKDFTVSGTAPSINSAAVFEFQGSDQTIAPLNYYVANFTGSGNKTLSSTDSTIINTYMTIGGTAQVVTNGKLVLRSTSGTNTAAIIDNTASATGVSGNVKVERYLPAKASNNGGSTPPGWFFSSPVSSAKLYDFSPVNNNIYEYINTKTAGQRWTVISPSNTVVPGKGYLVRSYASKKNYFYGSANSGSISYPIVYVGNGASDDNWNLIGNPYPSRLIWDASVVDMSHIGASQVCKIYTSGTQGYTFVNADINSRIALGQGIFVQAASSGPVIFNNTARTSVGATLQRQEEAYSNFLEVTVHKRDMFDRAAIIAQNSPTLSTKFDTWYDGTKLFPSSVAPAIYMQKEGRNLDIFTFGVSEGTVKVPLYLTLPSDTSYSINFTGAEKVDPLYYIYLIDSVQNVYHDVRKNTKYDFSSAAGTNKRFSVLFSLISTDADQLGLDENQTYVSSQNGIAYVNSKTIPSKVTIRDMSGKIVYNSNSPSTKTLILDLSNNPTGLYIATVETSNNVISRKFVLNK